MKLLNTFKGLWLMIRSTRIFYPKEHLKGKRVAIIGAADSAFEKENGNYIDSFDIIVRVNKAPHSWSPDKAKFIGSRTDILFHSFYENEISGGGPIDLSLYKNHGIKYIINPNNNLKGLRVHLNYFKRNLNNQVTFLLPRKFYKQMTLNFGRCIPTVGYSGLYSVLHSSCREVYISGFTFFKTPYAKDYRDHFRDMESNNNHIRSQGIHNPDLEFNEFLSQLDLLKQTGPKILLDTTLSVIIKNQRNL